MVGMIIWGTHLLDVKAPASAKIPSKVWKLIWDQTPHPGTWTRTLGR